MLEAEPVDRRLTAAARTSRHGTRLAGLVDPGRGNHGLWLFVYGNLRRNSGCRGMSLGITPQQTSSPSGFTAQVL